MFHGFFFAIGWRLAELVFGIVCYEVVRYLFINKVKTLFTKKPKKTEDKV
jgi:hypothetical protein